MQNARHYSQKTHQTKKKKKKTTTTPQVTVVPIRPQLQVLPKVKNTKILRTPPQRFPEDTLHIIIEWEDTISEATQSRQRNLMLTVPPKKSPLGYNLCVHVKL